MKQKEIRFIDAGPAERAEEKQCRINGTMPNARRLSVGRMLLLTEMEGTDDDSAHLHRSSIHRPHPVRIDRSSFGARIR